MDSGVQMPSTMSFPNSGSSRKAGDGVSDQFPAGLRVLVVDDDPTCLMILDKMLRTCLYEVTKSNRAEKALSLLRENRNGYDIIISDVHMPDMDGFKLLELVGLEMDLPVIMMSADDSNSVVMKGITHGACDYLIKPVRIEALKNIWQHVIRRKKQEWKDFGQSGSIDDGERQQKPNEDAGYSSSANEENWGNSKRKKEEEDEVEDKEDTSTLKKPRVVWSVELHQQFMAAVDQLGVDKAVPKKILELMNVPGLTRENVASHLQKYRLYLRRLSGVSHHQAGLVNPYTGPRDATFGMMSSRNGHDLQALAATGHLPAQSLATLQAATLPRSHSKSTVSMPGLDQRNNIFSFENHSNLRFGDSHNNDNNNINVNKQVNLLHGIPTTMEPKQLANFQGMNMQPNPGGRDSSLMVQMNNGNNSYLSRPSSSLPIMQQSSFLTNGIFTHNELASNVRPSVYNPDAQPTSTVSFSTSQSNMEKGLFQNEVISKESRGFDPSYDILSDLVQHKTNNWDLPNVGPSFQSTSHVSMQGNSNSLNVQPSVLVHQGFSSGQNGLQNRNGNGNGFGNAAPNMGQQLNMFLGENSPRVKSELFPEISPQNTLFPDQFGQDDLLSALLKPQDGIGQVQNDFGFDAFPPLDNLPV